MYHLHYLESLDDARLDVFARMTDVQLRSRIEPERGVFIAETAEVIGRALDAGMQVQSLLTAEEHLASLGSLIARIETAAPEAPLFALPGSKIGRAHV